MFPTAKNNLSYVIYHIEARLYTGQECVFSSKHEILERLLQDSEKALDHVFKYSFWSLAFSVAKLLLASYSLPLSAAVPFCYQHYMKLDPGNSEREWACQPGRCGLAQLLN